QIRSEVQRMSLGEAVSFSGTLGEEDVLKLRQSDVLVLASTGLGEASPVAVMEAMSTGMPVICSRIGGTPEMITDGVDGFLVDRGDEQGLASKLTMLAESAELRARIGAAARRRAVEQFDIRRTTLRLLDAIERHTAWHRPHVGPDQSAAAPRERIGSDIT